MKPARDVVNHSQSTDFAEKPTKSVKLFMLIVAITEKMSLVKVSAKADAAAITLKSALSSSFNKTGGITFTARKLCIDIESKYLCKMSRY
jgi:lambda repressor-like predicted transcriptional regulator